MACYRLAVAKGARDLARQQPPVSVPVSGRVSVFGPRIADRGGDTRERVRHAVPAFRASRVPHTNSLTPTPSRPATRGPALRAARITRHALASHQGQPPCLPPRSRSLCKRVVREPFVSRSETGARAGRGYIGKTLKLRRRNFRRLGAAPRRIGRDKSGGLRTRRPSAPVQVGMEGDGAWPAMPVCFCPGLSEINSIPVLTKVAKPTLVGNGAIPDLRVRQAASRSVRVCPTSASKAGEVAIR